MENCVFCKIISGEIKTKILYEEKDFIIINDLHPQAKNHYLIIPKNHYPTFDKQTQNDTEILGKILNKIPKLKDYININNGFKLIINQGEEGGQTVPHLHIHILNGLKNKDKNV